MMSSSYLCFVTTYPTVRCLLSVARAMNSNSHHRGTEYTEGDLLHSLKLPQSGGPNDKTLVLSDAFSLVASKLLCCI